MDVRLLRAKISVGSVALTGVLYILAGLLMLLWMDGIPSMVKIMILVYTASMTFFGVLSCLSRFKWTQFVQALLPLAIGILFVTNSFSVSTLFAFLMGIYIALIAFFRLIDFIILNANKNSGRWYALLMSCITFLFALPLIINPSIYVNQAILVTSIFCIFHGLTYIGDFLMLIAPSKSMAPYKRKIRINMPILFTSFLPKKMVRHLNYLLSVDADGVLMEDSFKGEDKADLEVLIHATEKGFSSMGHVDIVFEDKMYSFGNYDPESWKLFETIGDGVLLVVEGREKYIQFRLEDVGNSIFAFGLKLNDEQKEKVRKQIEKLYQHTIPWKSKGQKESEGLLTEKNATDYASRLYRSTQMTSYKFEKTSFKGYFAMTTNCVKLADSILRSAGIAAAMPNGILTPGGYYDFFNYQYGFKKSIVVSRQSYHPKGTIQHEEIKIV